jgi:hypothetical protein
MVRQLSPSLASMSAVFGAPPVKMKALKGVSVFSEALGAVNLLRGAGSGVTMARGSA